MRKTFTHLFVLLCCMAASLTASAQFKATVEQYPEGYKVSNATFSLTEVAAAVGTDTATLTPLLREWMATEGDAETNYFFLANSEDASAPYSNYTQGGKGGFWMTKTAPITPVSWTGEVGDDAWYNVLSIEDADLVIGVGQHPDAFTAGEEVSAQFLLVYGEKTATFDITLKVIEKPVVDIPAPTLVLADLNIVGEQTVEVRQYPRGDYSSTKQEVDLNGVAELLGTTDAVIAENIADLLFSTVQKSTEEDAEFLGDSISNTSTAGAPGFWFGRLWDKANEVPAVECASANWSAGKNLVFFSEAYAYNAETKILSSNIGQKGGELKVGDEMLSNIYLVWGNKAYHIAYHFVIEEAPVINPDELVEAGSDEFVCEFYVSSNDYSGTSINVDVDAVAELLGVAKNELSFKATADETGAMTDQSSANNGGYWLNAEGYRCSYNEGFFFIEPNTSGNFSTFSVGQYPGKLEAGTTYTAKLYLVGGTKYYTINLVLKPTAKPTVEVEFESVATKVINIQVVPSNGYGVDMTGDVDMTEMEELVGTSNLTLYGTAKPQEGDEEWVVRYTDEYTCTPYPGFWIDSQGYVSTWGSSPWGVTYSGGTFTFYQMPNHADNAAGASYKSNVYLVNEATGKMVTCELHVQFVSQIVKADEVGSTTIALPLSVQKDQSLYTDVDMSEVVEALGVADASEMLSSTQPLKVTLSDGSFNEGMSASEGAGITAAGFLDEDTEGYSNSVLFLYLEASDGNIVTVETNNYNGTFSAGDRIKVKAAIEVPAIGDANAKRFILNLVIVDPESYVGVRDIKTQNTDNTIFDLSGRRVNASAQKGIYIVGGKKVVK